MPATPTMIAKCLAKMQEFPRKLWTAESLAVACGYIPSTKGQVSGALQVLKNRNQVKINHSVLRRGQTLRFWTLA